MTVEFPWEIVPRPAEGEKRSGYLTWPDVVLQGWQWPYIAVRGRQPGRAVAVVAAVHGGEYPGILGALRLGRVLNPERVHGALLILPIVNLPSFWGRTAFVTPTDGRNLNRVFPGNLTGTFSEVLAYRLLRDVVQPAGAVIDLHSGDVFETLASHVYRYRTDNDGIDQLTTAMVEAFGAAYGITYPFPARPGSLAGNAVLLGKPAILAEVGGNGLSSDDDVYSVYQGLINTLRALGVLEGLRPPVQVTWLAPGIQATAPVTGLWRPAVTLHQAVRPGDLLGALTDPLGDELARVASTQAGVVVYYLSALAAQEGDPLVYYASAV